MANADPKNRSSVTEGDPADAKRAWRRRLLAERRALSAEAIAAAGPSLARQVIALAESQNAAFVAGYVALPGEPPTSPLLAALLDRGIRVLLPRLAGAGLEFVEWDGGPLGSGGHGTKAPVHGTVRPLSDAQLVVAPALAVDRRGARLGRGGGGYDRALAQKATNALVVALLWEGELVSELPAEPHDLPVAAVVTPTRTVRLSRPK